MCFFFFYLGTVTDQLRNAVSTALGSTQRDTDANSIDLNDMNDDEAERLDAALSVAFQMMKKTSGAGNNSKKKSKKERATKTTVMHFRIRVLDLIEIYLKTNPTLSISLEIMLSLFNMIEYCIDGDLKPLSDKVDRVLKRLLALREFANTEDVTMENLCDLLKSLVEKKVNPISLSAHNKLLSKSFHFLISNSNSVTGDSTLILNLIQEYAKEYITSRNPTLSFNLLQDIFKIRWIGIWNVAQCLAEEGLQITTIRSFRRTQIMEIITLMYQNHGFINNETVVDIFNRLNKSIEMNIGAYVKRLKDSEQISQKEFIALLNLLLAIHKCYKSDAVKSKLNWILIGEQVQAIRQNVTVESISAYTRFCTMLGLKILKKAHINGEPNVKQNGLGQKVTLQDVSKEPEPKKRKLENNIEIGYSKKEKKLKKAERLRMASEGLNGFSFSDKTCINSDEDVDDIEMN